MLTDWITKLKYDLIFMLTFLCVLNSVKLTFQWTVTKNIYMFKDTTNAKRCRFDPTDILQVRNSLSLYYALLKQNNYCYRNTYIQNCTKTREMNPRCKPHHISTNCNMVNIHQCNLNTSPNKCITAVQQNVEVKWLFTVVFQECPT
jgi:hypothetical protein